MLRGQGKYWPNKTSDDFKNFIISLIISLFISELYNFDPRNYKCKSLSLDKLLILRSRL